MNCLVMKSVPWFWKFFNAVSFVFSTKTAELFQSNEQKDRQTICIRTEVNVQIYPPIKVINGSGFRFFSLLSFCVCLSLCQFSSSCAAWLHHLYSHSKYPENIIDSVEKNHTIKEFFFYQLPRTKEYKTK